MKMYYKSHKGSALTMSLAILLVLTIVLLTVLPVASASISNSKKTIKKENAKQMAMSMVTIFSEQITKNADSDEIKSLLNSAKAAGASGMDYHIRATGQSFDNHVVNVIYSGDEIKVRATYEKDGSSYTACSLISKKYVGGELGCSEPIVEPQLPADIKMSYMKLLGKGTAPGLTKYTKEDMPEKITIVNAFDDKKAVVSIDDRNSSEQYTAYNIFSPTVSITADSYGDIYFIIPEGHTINLAQLTSKYYAANIYIIIENNASLRLTSATRGQSGAINAHIYGTKGSTLLIDGSVVVNGDVVVDNISFTDSDGKGESGLLTVNYSDRNELSGNSASKGEQWYIVKYYYE